jgi:hypothetical protein
VCVRERERRREREREREREVGRLREQISTGNQLVDSQIIRLRIKKNDIFKKKIVQIDRQSGGQTEHFLQSDRQL